MVYLITEPVINSPPQTELLIANWNDAADFKHLLARIANATKISETVQDKRVKNDALLINAMLRDIFSVNSDAVILNAHDKRALESR